jgi:hypothetical protein
MQNCKICSREFLKSSSIQIYCSWKCRRKSQLAAYKKKEVVSVQCETCQTTFTPTWNTNKYCSAKCKRNSYRSPSERGLKRKPCVTLSDEQKQEIHALKSDGKTFKQIGEIMNESQWTIASAYYSSKPKSDLFDVEEQEWI